MLGNSRALITAFALAAIVVVASLLAGTSRPPVNSGSTSGNNPSNPPNTTGPHCKGTAACFTGTVTNIVDGDTLDVGTTRIRLTLVNTPEVGYAGYQEGKDFAANFCQVGSTALVDEDDGQTGGSYGRTIAVVYCHDRNLNAALLTAGFADVLTQYCSVSEFASDAWAAPYC